MSKFLGVAKDELTPNQIAQAQADLRDNTDPAQGAGVVGWVRSAVDSKIDTAGEALSAQPATLWEYANLVTVKPIPADPSSWDWKPALLAAAAAFPVVDGLGQTYRISAITIPGKIKLININFKPALSVTGGVLVTIAGDDSEIDVSIDAEGEGIGGVEVSGNRVRGHVSVANVIGQLQATGGTQGALKLSGTDCDMSVYAENLLIGTSTNTSIPRLITTDNTNAGATRNTFRAVGKNVQCGWVTTQNEVHCRELIIDTVMDNGIYHLQGRATAGTIRIRDCHDEPVVCKVDHLHIDDLTVIDSNAFCSMSSGHLSIGTYQINSSDPTKAMRALSVRADNGTSRAEIGVLQGSLYLTPDVTIGGIFQFEAGIVSSLKIGVMNLDVHYNVGSTKILANMSVLQSLDIGLMSINLIDESGSLTFADKLDFRLPTALSQSSRLQSVQNISSTGEIRITNAAQNNLQLGPGMEVSTAIGPYILQENPSFPSPPEITGTGVPVVGTWPRGARVAIKAPFAGGVSEYTCITAGSPGSWRASKWIVGRNITASRPTLTANDVGVMFMDNTLAAAGKPIWWNGTAWVDATGTVV